MRSLTWLLVYLFVVSCSSDRASVVEDFVAASSKCNIQQLKDLSSDDFGFVAGIKKMNKTQYLDYVNGLKSSEPQFQLLELTVHDSIVRTKERIVTLLDTLLEIKPRPIQAVTYIVRDGKVKRLTIDSILNSKEYEVAFDDKLAPFAMWLETNHEGKAIKQLTSDLKPLLQEYVKLSDREKKQYELAAQLKGTYVSHDNPFYRKLIFKGKSTVVVVDAWIGYEFATSYEIDENYIRIRTDKSDLLFKIKDKKTLIGEGFAKGTFRKSL